MQLPKHITLKTLQCFTAYLYTLAKENNLTEILEEKTQGKIKEATYIALLTHHMLSSNELHRHHHHHPPFQFQRGWAARPHPSKGNPHQLPDSISSSAPPKPSTHTTLLQRAQDKQKRKTEGLNLHRFQTLLSGQYLAFTMLSFIETKYMKWLKIHISSIKYLLTKHRTLSFIGP